MDKIDKKILTELQNNSKQRVSQLSKKLNIPRTTINNRIKKFEALGIIKKYKVVLNWEKLNKPLCALVHIVITSKESVYEVAERIKKKGNVEEVYIMAGQFDIIAKVRLENMKELAKFIFDSKSGLRGLPSVERTESMLVVDKVLEDGVISI